MKSWTQSSKVCYVAFLLRQTEQKTATKELVNFKKQATSQQLIQTHKCQDSGAEIL